MSKKTFSGNIVDVVKGRIFPGSITVEEGMITELIEDKGSYDGYIIPGFIDSHIHIESSMLPPSEFARLALQHGTVAVVSDPHEIANVLGSEGIRFMIENAESVPLKFYFSAPSCVPATNFETAGADLSAEAIEELFDTYPNIRYLGEMMNYPAVIRDDPAVHEKIAAAHKHGKCIDGHAPGLLGRDLQKYIGAGISTDHECVTKEEALEKLSLGMKIQIREGSAAKNFDTLIDLAAEHGDNCMFCSDDKHPDDLLSGHINDLVVRSVRKGIDVIKTLRMASLNPVKHYGLDVGLLQKGDHADFLVVDSLDNFRVQNTVINGKIVCRNGHLCFARKKAACINRFKAGTIEPRDLYMENPYAAMPVIVATDDQLITRRVDVDIKTENHNLVSDPFRDILKIAVINRYENKRPSIGFIKNFGLKKGAIASSVLHDSHNIIVVGVSEEDMADAVNIIVREKGGISLACKEDKLSESLPLSIAGLMSDRDYAYVASQYGKLDHLAKGLGSTLKAPFMTLSFMALLVIPEIKLSDKGLFDGNTFQFIKQ